jgi:hypothetical protein
MIVEIFYNVTLADLKDDVNSYLTAENIPFGSYTIDWEFIRALPLRQNEPRPVNYRDTGWYATISAAETIEFENTLQSGLQFGL